MSLIMCESPWHRGFKGVPSHFSRLPLFYFFLHHQKIRAALRALLRRLADDVAELELVQGVGLDLDDELAAGDRGAEVDVPVCYSSRDHGGGERRHPDHRQRAARGPGAGRDESNRTVT